MGHIRHIDFNIPGHIPSNDISALEQGQFLRVFANNREVWCEHLDDWDEVQEVEVANQQLTEDGMTFNTTKIVVKIANNNPHNKRIPVVEAKAELLTEQN